MSFSHFRVAKREDLFLFPTGGLFSSALFFFTVSLTTRGINTSHCLWTCSLSVWEKKCWSGFWDLLLNTKRGIGIFLSPGETIDERNPSEIKTGFLVLDS